MVLSYKINSNGFISRYGNYDEFDEVAQILKHSEQSFFTGDNFQMLNSKYDQGIDRISKVIQEKELERFVIELSWKSSKMSPSALRRSRPRRAGK